MFILTISVINVSNIYMWPMPDVYILFSYFD